LAANQRFPTPRLAAPGEAVNFEGPRSFLVRSIVVALSRRDVFAADGRRDRVRGLALSDFEPVIDPLPK
jgi:hypothetical protein